MKVICALAAVAMVAATSSYAQQSSRSTTQAPGGTYEGYQQSRPGGQQQAELPNERPADKAHPGTLRKFNSNRGGGPEVEFETQAQKQAVERAKMRR